MPLVLAAQLDGRLEGRSVYAAGYPAKSQGAPIDVQTKTFADVYGIKRLQPGQILGVEYDLVVHDCFTLPGNAGSPIVDLQTGLVIGLHFAGRWVEYKRGVAVALWRLAELPAFADVGVSFVSPS